MPPMHDNPLHLIQNIDHLKAVMELFPHAELDDKPVQWFGVEARAGFNTSLLSTGDRVAVVGFGPDEDSVLFSDRSLANPPSFPDTDHVLAIRDVYGLTRRLAVFTKTPISRQFVDSVLSFDGSHLHLLREALPTMFRKPTA